MGAESSTSTGQTYHQALAASIWSAAIHDVPWAVELSNGQLIVGAYWHDRFGIEHGPGNIELSPVDAGWLFHWMEPEVPAGWHAVTETPKGEGVPIVNVRK